MEKGLTPDEEAPAAPACSARPCALGASQAAARPAHASAFKTVTVVMHDPGCHWFSVGGKLVTTLSVKGPVKLLNYDEASLRIVGPHATIIQKIGKPLLLAKGVYRITMVQPGPR